MAILTVIDGVPLYSTVEEALNYADANNLTGYHTHIYNGQTGYMGGATHGNAATSSSGFDNNNITDGDETNVSNIPSGSSGGY